MPYRLVVIVVSVLLSGCFAFIPADTTPDIEPVEDTNNSAVDDGPPLRMIFVDAGQADAILLDFGDTEIMIDAGRSFSTNLQTVLSGIESPLEMLIITHPHIDHYGGAKDILDNHTVLEVITNGERRGPPRDAAGQGVTWLDFEDQITSAGLETNHLQPGDEILFEHDLRITVLATGSPEGGAFRDSPQGSDINNDSLVLMVEYAGRRILLSGDIEIAAGQMLVENYCNSSDRPCPQLRADILKVPHHGSEHFYPDFFSAVQPTWSVFTAAYNRPQGRHCLPRRRTLEALVDVGSRIKSTNHQGGADIVVDILPTGEIIWHVEEPEVFVWTTTDDGCFGEVCRAVDDNAGIGVSCRGVE